MAVRPATLFRKTLACPSVQELLAFHLHDLTPVRDGFVADHLPGCEFCGAELQMLSEHPQADLCCCDETAALPASLRRLAEALMGHAEPALRALIDSSELPDPVAKI